jgi:hypothetical protein
VYSNQKLVTLAALLIVIISFSVLAANTPENNGVKVSKDQAIAAVERSLKVNTVIVSGNPPISVELQWMKIDWEQEFWLAGQHQHIYVTATPPGDYSPYWRIEYTKRLNVTNQPWIYVGSYIVDATTGELMSAFESFDLDIPYSHPPTGAGDYSITFKPDIYGEIDPIKLKAGDVKSFDLTIVTDPSIDAYLPIAIQAVDVRPDLVVTQNATSVTRGPGGSAYIRFSVSSRGVSSGSILGFDPGAGFEISVKDYFSGYLYYVVHVVPVIP